MARPALDSLAYLQQLLGAIVCKDLFLATCAQPDGKAYAIFDAANATARAVESAPLPTTTLFKADTLEDLARAAGIDLEAFVATVEQYNAAVSSGAGDADFGVAADKMASVAQPPFYAVEQRPYMYGGGIGLKVDEECAVLNSQDEVVPGLYAAGEMCFTGGLSFLGGALATGRIAAESAKASL